MADKNGSLLVAAREQFEAQPELFEDPEIPKIDKTKPRYDFTGEQLFQRRPDILRRLCK